MTQYPLLTKEAATLVLTSKEELPAGSVSYIENSSNSGSGIGSSSSSGKNIKVKDGSQIYSTEEAWFSKAAHLNRYFPGNNGPLAVWSNNNSSSSGSSNGISSSSNFYEHSEDIHSDGTSINTNSNTSSYMNSGSSSSSSGSSSGSGGSSTSFDFNNFDLQRQFSFMFNFLDSAKSIGK